MTAATRSGAALAVLAIVAACLALQRWLAPALAAAPIGLALVGPAALFAAWWGGFWPGALTASLLSLLLTVVAGVRWQGPLLLFVALALLSGLVCAALAQSLLARGWRWHALADAAAGNERRLAAALQAAGCSAYVFDTDLRCTWSRALSRMSATTGRGLDALFEPRDVPHLEQALRQALAGVRAQRLDVVASASAGSADVRVVEHCIEPLRDADGRIIGACSVAREVGALRAEQRQTELLRAAHDASPEPFELLRALRDETGRVSDFVWEYANPAAIAQANRGAALVGERVIGGGGALGQHRQRPRTDAWRELLAPERAPGDALRLPLSPEQPDGGADERFVEMLAVRLDRERLAVRSIDVSDAQHRLHAERERAATLQRAATRYESFLSHLSHELRAPLNAITGWAHLLAQPGAGNDAALLQRAAEAIGRNARAQATLVDALLDMHQIVGGRLSLRRDPACDLSAALERAVAAARPAAQAKWLRLHAHAIEPAVACEGDAVRLQQAFANLIDNAIKFTPLGGDVWVSLQRLDDASAQVEVRDNGQGVPAAVLPHFFAALEQARSDGARPHAGLGLGLTLVRTVVELHGGRVAVHSEGPGLGTSVRVQLPVKAASPRTAGTQPAALHAGAASERGAPARAAHHESVGDDNHAPPLNFRRILVLEDEADSLEVLSVLLRQQGAVVRAFDNAEQALAAAEHGSFDLVIGDLAMPGMDGLEFMRRLQRRPLPVKAIALTAYAGEAERAAALQAGYTRVQTKPISPPEFLAIVIAEVGASAKPV